MLETEEGGVTALQLVELAKMPVRPHQLLMLDDGPNPLVGLAALKFDLDVMRASRKFKRFMLQQSLQQVGGEGFGIPAILEVLSRIYTEN